MAKVGRKRFGFYPDEAAIIKVIKLKRRCRKGQDEDTPFRQIARELNFEGYRTRMDRLFCGQTVKDVLRPEG